MIPEDDEILQDFLVEAGEILELLGEQLVELEQNPEDADLLNAVFRGFHTVKGGAGFLNIVPMIDVCHRAEDVFNVLRQGERKITPDLMDSVLTVLDILNEQFSQISEGQELTVADPALLSLLESFAKPQSEDAEPVAEAVAEPAPEPISEPEPQPVEAKTPTQEQSEEEPSAKTASTTVPANSDDITDAEFESLLDALEADGKAPHLGAEDSEVAAAAPAAESNEDITEEEFESLLDELHGPAGSKKEDKPAQPVAQASAQPAAPPVAAAAAGANASADENITDDEFEDLLDQLHGEGKIDTTDMDDKKGKSIAKRKPAEKPKDEARVKEEAVAATLKQATKAAEPTVRVDTKRLDDIMNMVGELVLVRNRLDTLKAKINNEEISKAVGNLDIVTSDLQAAVMKTRMQPIKKVFGRFPRVVRDLARNLNKEVNLELMGEETDLDKNLVEALADPMVHLVRNSVDHGIEMPDIREKGKKKRAGTIVLSAAQEGDHILLTIEDDGAGMDANVLRRKAVEKGILDEDSAARLDDREAYNLIFSPGFSTKAEISDISGRGVGMDVVKTRISQLNGTIDIESELGKGTRISIKLPLTLAILPTLMVKVGARTFALPLSSVNEIFSLDSYHTNTVDGQLVIMVRNKAMPLFYLYKWLAGGHGQPDTDLTDQVVVANVGNQRVGFVVSQVVGQEEVVIKPLGALLHGLPGFAGATITGDGRIALILDIPSLMRARASGLAAA